MPKSTSIDWRFVTAVAKGEPHHLHLRIGGNAQSGDLSVMFSGPRVNATYTDAQAGGNSPGAMAATTATARRSPSMQRIYGSTHLPFGCHRPARAGQHRGCPLRRPSAQFGSGIGSCQPARIQVFTPGSSQETAVTFTNTTGAPAAGVALSISVPNSQWTSVVQGATDTSKTFTDPVAPGATVSATFNVTSGPEAFNGDLVANASATTRPTAKSNPHPSPKKFGTSARSDQ